MNKIKEKGEEIAKEIEERQENDEWARRRRIRERAALLKNEQILRKDAETVHAVARQFSKHESPSDSDTSAAHETQREKKRDNIINRERITTQDRKNQWKIIGPKLAEVLNKKFTERKKEERRRCVDTLLISGQWTPRTPEQWQRLQYLREERRKMKEEM